MNELLDKALKTLHRLENTNDVRYLREFVHDKQGLPGKLNGIEGGFAEYVLSDVLKEAKKAAEALDADDLTSLGIVVELLDDALRAKPGGAGRGHVEIKIAKRSYPQYEYVDGKIAYLTDENGEQIYEDFFYRYVYIRLHGGKGDKNRKRRKHLAVYADKGMGRSGTGGVVAAALDENLVSEEDVLDAFHGKDEGVYDKFVQHCADLLSAQGIGGAADDEQPEPAPSAGRKGMPARSAGKAVSTPAKASSAQADYQIKIALLEVRPVVWRRFRVPGDITFRELHEIACHVMGWEGYHLFQFVVGDHNFKDDTQGHEDLPASYGIARYLQRADQHFGYDYDFGNMWEHEMVIEKILPPSPAGPICLAGKRACPPEDCGGPENFMAYLKARKKRRVPGWLKEQIGAQYAYGRSTCKKQSL